MKSATRPAMAWTSIERPPLILQLRPVLELTDDQFFELAQLNRDVRLERTAEGGLIVMPPVGGASSDRNAEITMQLRSWAKRDGTGVAFDSSGGFILPNRAVRSPDASWVSRPSLVALTAGQWEKFLPLCPEFVIELRSPTDTLRAVQEKMQEYLDNGARLGWLIDPLNRRVYVYRPRTPVEQLEAPETLSGDPLLAGFVLDLREIWPAP